MKVKSTDGAFSLFTTCVKSQDAFCLTIGKVLLNIHQKRERNSEIRRETELEKRDIERKDRNTTIRPRGKRE